MVAPIVILMSWWLSWPILTVLGWSFLASPVMTLLIQFALQTGNPGIKFPIMQWIGVGTVLMNVVFFISPLLFFLNATTVAAIATVTWLLISIYAAYTAHNVKNTKLVVQSSKLTKSLRIMHLSDLHAGSRSDAFIDRMVTQTLEQTPDMVLITGDLIDSGAVDATYLAPLAKFTCPVYMSLGNHERYLNLQKAIDAIEANNVQILRNDTVINGSVQITGIDDEERRDQVADKLSNIPRKNNLYQILMYHRPEGFEDAAMAGIDLMLSGHTHAGQMFPFNVPVKKRFPLLKGRYSFNKTVLYVSQGTGTWGPTMRLGTISEMTLIEALPA